MACCLLVLAIVDAVRARWRRMRAARLRRAGRFDEAVLLDGADVREIAAARARLALREPA